MSAAVQKHDAEVEIRAGDPWREKADVLQTLYRMRALVGTSGRQAVVLQAQGQALIEYALIVSLIGLVAIVSLKLAGTNISGILHTIAGEV